MASYILGIESSCDDTSVAVIDDTYTIHSNVIASQFQEHSPYHGVVPEIASRTHLINIEWVFRKALDDAGCTLDGMSAIAVTAGPGLKGSLMVGINFAKGLALGSAIPLIPVNHIRGHVAALFLEHDISLPALALIVSGGHSHLFLVYQDRSMDLLVKTRDDAAGEAYDKLSKMLGLGFPGGPIIDRLAKEGRSDQYRFAQPKFSDGSHSFSFSGMKTNALHHITKNPESFRDPDGQGVRDLCASFQRAAVTHLLNRVTRGIKKHRVRSLLLGGGVACNSLLRSEFTQLAQQHRLPGFLSSPRLSTDNAAMIAAEGLLHLREPPSNPLACAPDIRWNAYTQYLGLS